MLARGFHCWDQNLPKQSLSLRSPGERAEEQRLLQELHLALDRILQWPLVLVEHWAVGASSYRMWEGAGHPHPNPVEFLFYHQSMFVPLIFFPFPSGYRTSSKQEGIELILAMNQYTDIDLGVPALL